MSRPVVSKCVARLPRGGLFARIAHDLAEVEAICKDSFYVIRPIKGRVGNAARERMLLPADVPSP
jgi:hypothetical protein